MEFIGGSIFEPTDIFCIADELNRTVKKVDVYEEREIGHASALYNNINAPSGTRTHTSYDTGT